MINPTEKTRLVERIDRILDESRARSFDLLIQRPGIDPETEKALDGVVEATLRRRVATTARSVLPLERARFEGKRSAYSRRILRERGMSMLSQVTFKRAPVSGETGDITYIRESARADLEAVTKLDAMRGTMSRLEDAAKGKPGSPVRLHWASRSLGISMRRDELGKLRDAVREGQPLHVFRNAPVKPPSYSTSSQSAAVKQSQTASAWGVQRINALAAWGAFGNRGSGVRVAVLDTGVDADHPDLTRDNGDSKVVSAVAFDRFGDQIPGDPGADVDDHGTHVCGTIAGGRGDDGIWVGVAPDCDILSGRVLEEDGGTVGQIIAGVQWAIEQGANVISMSLGDLDFGPFPHDLYTQTIISALQAGIPVVAAIGNDGHQTSGAPANDFFSLAVGATDIADRTAAFSGGRSHLLEDSQFIAPRFLPLPYITPKVSAPGVEVLSAKRGGGRHALNGTSMATPHVAGALALLLANTDIRASFSGFERAMAAEDLLVGSVREMGEQGQDQRYGFGLVDVLAAIGEAKRGGF